MIARFALLAVLAPQALLAQEAAPATGRAPFIGAGVMHPEADRQLSKQDGHPSFVAGMTWRYSRHLAFELDFMDTGQEAEMPTVERSGLGTSGSRQREHINVDGIAGRMKLIYPAGKLEPYVGVGVGYYYAEISNLGTLTHLVLPSDFAKRTDKRAGGQLILGLDYKLAAGSTLGFEYRRLALDANFGPEFGGRTKVGGGMALLVYRGALH